MKCADQKAYYEEKNLFFRVVRPLSYWNVVVAHLPVALASGAALLISFFVPIDRFPFRICTFFWLTGYPCPFCGLTRSFAAMAHGEWSYAVGNSPLAGILYLVVAVVFVWNVAGLLLSVKISRGQFLKPNTIRSRWILATFIVLLVINWLYRLSMGLS